jgi:hypothetical protein
VAPATIGSAAALLAGSPFDDDLDVGAVTEVLSQGLVQLIREITWDQAEGDGTTPRSVAGAGVARPLAR